MTLSNTKIQTLADLTHKPSNPETRRRTIALFGAGAAAATGITLLALQSALGSSIPLYSAVAILTAGLAVLLVVFVLPKLKASSDTKALARVEPGHEKDVIAFVSTLLMRAVQNEAEEIQIDSSAHNLHIHLQNETGVDPVAAIDKPLHPSVVARIKHMAQLNPANSAPQHGQIRLKMANNTDVNIEVSAVPTQNGERITMRLGA